jgi:hypothetical protein
MNSKLSIRAFSSEACPWALDPRVGIGSREENAAKQEIRARLRFNQKQRALVFGMVGYSAHP